MPRKQIEFSLDFMKKDIFSRFSVKQFDDVSLNITPLIQNKPYDTTNMIGKIYVGVNNDMFKQDTNITVSSNSIVVTLDKNMLNKDGRVYAEIELTDSNGTITSSSFVFDIEPKIGEGATIPGAIDGFVEKYKKLTEEFKKQFQTYTTDLNDRFNTLTSEQQQDAEVIDARKGEISLRKKIDKIDEQFNTIQSKKLDKTGILTMANMGQDVKEAMTGGSVAVVGKNTILNENIVDKQISFEKLDNMTCDIVKGENLKQGIYVDNYIGTYLTYKLTSLSYSTMYEVKPNSKYKLKLKDNNRFRVVGVTTIPAFNNEEQYEVQQVIIDDDSQNFVEFTTNENIFYIFVYAKNGDNSYTSELYDLDTMKFTNELQLDYLTGKNIAAKHIKTYKTISIGLLENKYYIAKGISKYNTQLFHVNKNTDYVVKIIGDFNRFRIAGMKTHIDISDLMTRQYLVDDMIISDDNYNDHIIFNSGDNVEVWVYTSNESQFANIEVYEEIPLKIYNKEVVTSGALKRTQDFILDKLESKYIFLTELKGAFNFKEIEKYNMSLQSTDVYSLFDTLNAEKTILGYDDIDKLPINKYVFKPITVDIGRNTTEKANIKTPTVLITSNIHGGDEKVGCWIVYNFFKMLETTEDENLLFLKDNVKFIVVPLVNPSGFNRGTRENGNGVDLNREFKKDESEMQIESRIMKQLIDTTEYDIMLDLHTMWPGKGKHTAWIISADKMTYSLDNSTIIHLSRQWKKRYPFMEQDETIFGHIGEGDYIDVSQQGTQMRAYSYKKGVKRSVTLELANTVQYNNETRYGELTTNLYFDLFVNYLIGIVKTLL